MRKDTKRKSAVDKYLKDVLEIVEKGWTGDELKSEIVRAFYT